MWLMVTLTFCFIVHGLIPQHKIDEWYSVVTNRKDDNEDNEGKESVV
jgi:hypothetical protein